MKMFTGEILNKVELNTEDKKSLRKFFDDAISELESNTHEHIILTEEPKLLYAKSGVGLTEAWWTSPKESFYRTSAHLLIKDGQIVAACLMTDFYDDFLTGDPYRFNLDKWIKSVDISDNKRKIYCYDGNIGIGFDNVIVDNNGEVELHLLTEREKSSNVAEEKIYYNIENSHLAMLRITRNIMGHIDKERNVERDIIEIVYK